MPGGASASQGRRQARGGADQAGGVGVESIV